MECPVCFNDLKIPYATTCKHQYCLKCLQQLTSKGSAECPLCRRNVAKGAYTPVLKEADYYQLILQCDNEIIEQLKIDSHLRYMVECLHSQVCKNWVNQSKAFQIYYYYNLYKRVRPIQQRQLDITRDLSTASHTLVYYNSEHLFFELLEPTIKSLGLAQNLDSITHYNSYVHEKYLQIKLVGFDPINTIITLENDWTMNLLQYHIYVNDGLKCSKRYNTKICGTLAQAYLSLKHALNTNTKNCETLMYTHFPDVQISEIVNSIRGNQDWCKSYHVWIIHAVLKRAQKMHTYEAKDELQRQTNLDWIDIEEILHIILQNPNEYHITYKSNYYYYNY